MSAFSLTVRQLEKILIEAKRDDNQEDILSFEVRDGRLIVSQNDWGHTGVKVIANKPC